jgi:predicted cobalt transporter CbtA
MVRGLLIRGMLAGLAAGILAFAFAKLFGEPPLDKAIAFEGATGEAPLVSRGMQSTPGLLTATVVYATALGGVFALVFAIAYGRLGKASPRRTAAVLAAVGFTVVFLVPFVKYPSNPPAVGNPDTIGERTQLYFLMVAISIAAAIAALRLRRVEAFLALVVVAQLAMPGVDELPNGFPADVLWDFRVATLGMHAVIWATLGLTFGRLASQKIGVEHPALAGTGFGPHAHDLVGDLGQRTRDEDLVRCAEVGAPVDLP